MANQNLSQFGENTSVSDADYTFVWDSAASISKKVSRNSWLNSGTLTSDAPVTISQTWNGTGSTVFTALKVNATSTASDPTSRLLDLQVGTVSQFNVRKNGQALFSSGIVSAPGITFLSGSNTGIWETSAGVHFSSAGTNAFGVRNEIRVNSSLAFGFASGTPADTGLDVALWRDAANTLALRNGAVAQTFRIYNTYSNAGVDVEYLQLSTSASGFRVGTNSSGSGSSRVLLLGVGGGSQWQINTSGHIGTFGSDNLYDIGASGANRPRDIYAGGNGIFGGLISALNGFRAPSSSQLIASANGIWRLTNSNADDFNRLQFGGTTNLFPAIKRSSTTLQARLADDSAFAPIQGKLTTDTAYTGTVVAATGYITIYDSTGTAYRVPCAV